VVIKHETAMANLQLPCLVLSNTGDAIHAIALRTLEARPDFAYVEMDGGTFDIIDEQPEAWVEAVTGWLAETA